jgi:hypothetical protein
METNQVKTRKSKGSNERTKTDAQGREIPLRMVRPEILKQDTVIRKTLDRVKSLHNRIKSDKEKLFQELEGYLEFMAEKHGLHWKGNAILLSFDEQYKVEIRFKERIQFGVELQLAKQKIDECLKEWTSDSNVNLRAIINEAFQVDKKGEIAKYRILALRRYNIKDATWKEAMELIDQAINVTSTKQYVAFYERDAAGNYQQIILNFSAL